MRDPQIIAREIDRARHSLDEGLGALKALVRSKLDVKQIARDAVERRVQKTREAMRRHPGVTALAACLVFALVYVAVRRRRA